VFTTFISCYALGLNPTIEETHPLTWWIRPQLMVCLKIIRLFLRIFGIDGRILLLSDWLRFALIFFVKVTCVLTSSQITDICCPHVSIRWGVIPTVILDDFTWDNLGISCYIFFFLHLYIYIYIYINEVSP
jgi:hypothetical protein